MLRFFILCKFYANIIIISDSAIIYSVKFTQIKDRAVSFVSVAVSYCRFFTNCFQPDLELNAVE